MKRRLSLIMVLVLLLQANICITPVFASDSDSYLYYETFDEYATNYRPDNVIGSMENRVIENGVRDKENT